MRVYVVVCCVHGVRWSGRACRRAAGKRGGEHDANPPVLCSYAGTDTNIPFLNITNKDECEWIWDLWGQQIEPLAAHMPYMTGVGNHEVFYNWTAFTHRYHMPTQDGGNGNFWFSYDYGSVHFTSLSTEQPYTPGSPQWLWAQQDLRKAVANRANVPWIVVTGHRPMCELRSNTTGGACGVPA